MDRQKKLSEKQRMALELLTCGKGLTFKEIAEQVNIDVKTLWRWRSEPEFALFQDELKRINDTRWMAAEDAARMAAIELCKEKNQKMVEFILKNLGYNPTNKIEADVNQDIVISIGFDEEEAAADGN